jgi:hypothetical protein
MGQDLGTLANINIAGNYGCSFPKYGFHKTHHHIAFATRAISVSLFSDLLENGFGCHETHYRSTTEKPSHPNCLCQRGTRAAVPREVKTLCESKIQISAIVQNSLKQPLPSFESNRHIHIINLKSLYYCIGLLHQQLTLEGKPQTSRCRGFWNIHVWESRIPRSTCNWPQPRYISWSLGQRKSTILNTKIIYRWAIFHSKLLQIVTKSREGIGTITNRTKFTAVGGDLWQTIIPVPSRWDRYNLIHSVASPCSAAAAIFLRPTWSLYSASLGFGTTWLRTWDSAQLSSEA